MAASYPSQECAIQALDCVGETWCWKCQQPTLVHAIALPPSHETLVEVDEEWEAQDFLQFLMYVDDPDPAVIVQLRKLFFPHWKIDYSQATGRSYWTCAALSDHFPPYGRAIVGRRQHGL